MSADDLPGFEPGVHISPITLFRRLAQDWKPHLLDVRSHPLRGQDLRSFAGALLWSEGQAPPIETDAVLFDQDGRRATALAKRLRHAGSGRIQALFGGLELYDLALDPAVVGDERFLRNFNKMP